MKLKNWKFHYPITEDIDKYHLSIGGLSDFFIDSKPGMSYLLCHACTAQGTVVGDPRFEDGSYIETSPVWEIKRVGEFADHAYVIVTKDGMEYHTTESEVERKFWNEAWTFGTPRALLE